MRAPTGFQGDFFTDQTLRTLYATDASAYRELPAAVAIPRKKEDISMLISWAQEQGQSLIPRTAGTSLAGQVVGSGVVVDVSKHFTNVLEINTKEQWVRVQPGVIRNELNQTLKPHGFLFGPETSTQNRAMIGGMVGNNSCGSNSVIYGSTRDHLLEVEGYLADGTLVTFGELTAAEFADKVAGKTTASPLEQAIYQQAADLLGDRANRQKITEAFPKPSIPRRNTGYALDLLMDAEPFGGDKPFNFCKLIAGSEGTLLFITEVKVHINPLPPAHKAVVACHFESLQESLQANLVALKYKPHASELMDHYVLDRTKTSREHSANRFFLQGEPKAILAVELVGHSEEELDATVDAMVGDMKAQSMGYHFPVLKGDEMTRIWDLRKAGLGLLSNMVGDAKPVPVIEDTAVDVADLPQYIADFNEKLAERGLFCVHYAHAGSGELHLRPIIDLKTVEGNALFRTVLEDIAELVKKYQGSLSGEHGDGRLRGEFIPLMVGDEVYGMMKAVKAAWDPHGLFNPGKIVDTPPMNESLRYTPGQATPELETVFDFSDTQGFVRAAEFCNGSGDCRKTHLTGGTMCPSYMATKDEKDTTRARANILREVMSGQAAVDAWQSEEVKEVLDLCLSCKGCKRECPSNVDMAKLKAEFMHHYYEAKGVPLRVKFITGFTKANKAFSKVPWLYNFLFGFGPTAAVGKAVAGFHQRRSMPKLHRTTVRSWWAKQGAALQPAQPKRKVQVFLDEFTDYNDVPQGQAALTLLCKLGYAVEVPDHIESGRPHISKGLLKEAQAIARKNVSLLAGSDVPLVGIEPSAVLTLRDEYVDLTYGEEKEAAKRLAARTYTLEEFIAQEAEAGHIGPDQFTTESRTIKLHGHCQQKALVGVVPSKRALSLPLNYRVENIPSGCCGMCGSFGYEKEHYDLSMKVGELVLLPAARKAKAEGHVVAAAGTSCRHQMHDGAQVEALHPAQILLEALKD